jgi:hypothetical protein
VQLKDYPLVRMQQPVIYVVLFFKIYFMKPFFICISVLLFMAIGIVNGQSSDTIPCPVLSLKGPKDNKIAEGKELAVSVVPLVSGMKIMSLLITGL